VVAPKGGGRVLSATQEDAIQRIIIDTRPEQLKMDFFLWSRAAVGQLIEQEYGLKLQVRSIGKYLARWGFTPQRPIKRAYEQNPEAVQAWLQGEYPGIEQRAKREGAEIHWGDETALTNTDVRGRSYAPAGKTPVALTVGMKDALREGDTLARLGGDEFVAVLLDLDAAASLPMSTACSPPRRSRSHGRRPRAAGVGQPRRHLLPAGDEVDADQLLRQADQAMYQAKLAGKNRYHVFDADQDRSVRGRHESLERIRAALAPASSCCTTSPRSTCARGQVIGAEALIRWQHPSAGCCRRRFSCR
jgi:hypothetical protein